MTIRRLNYTERKSIPQARIELALLDDAVRTVEGRFSFEGLHIPPEAVVYLHAYSSGSPKVSRIRVGPVGGLPNEPARFALDVDGATVRFDILVVDESRDIGRIVAVTRGVAPRRGDGIELGSARSLLPVNPADLGNEIWSLKFTSSGPWLEVNRNVRGIKGIVSADPTFQALVFPEVVRAVLERIIRFEAVADADEDTWVAKWVRWAGQVRGDGEPPPDDDEADTGASDAWISEVVSSFANRNGFFARFVETLADEE